MYLLTIAFLAGACSSTNVAERAPAQSLVPAPAEPQPAAEIDLDAAGEVFADFLAARWSFDAEQTLAYVTQGDRDDPWLASFEQWEELGKVFARDGEWRDWFDHSVVDMQPLEDGSVQGSARVTSPTSASLFQLQTRRQIESIRVMTKLSSMMKLPAAQAAIQRELQPAKVSMIYRYRLVETDDGWRVDMQWPDLKRRLDGDGDLNGFSGSEFLWVYQHVVNRASVAGEQSRELALAVDQAEQLAESRRYNDAIVEYDGLLASGEVPEFIFERPTRLEEKASEWEAARKAAGLRFTPREIVAEKDGGYVLAVELENTGDSAISDLLVSAEYVVGARSETAKKFFGRNSTSSKRVKRLAPQTRETVLLQLNTEGKAPRVVSAQLLDFHAEGIEVPQRVDHPFRWALQDFERGRPYPYAPTRVSNWVHARDAQLERCDGWPEEPFEVRVGFLQDGTVLDVGTTAGEAVFKECVKAVVRELRMPPSPRAWAAAVQLIPPGYWDRVTTMPGLPK